MYPWKVSRFEPVRLNASFRGDSAASLLINKFDDFSLFAFLAACFHTQKLLSKTKKKFKSKEREAGY